MHSAPPCSSVPDFPPVWLFSMPQVFPGLWAHVFHPGSLVSTKSGYSMPLSSPAQSWDAASTEHTLTEMLVPNSQPEILTAPQSSCLLVRCLYYISGWEASASGTAVPAGSVSELRAQPAQNPQFSREQISRWAPGHLWHCGEYHCSSRHRRKGSELT